MSTGAGRVTVLGSGTYVPDGARASAAHLVEAPGSRLLLDCGSGTLHGLARHDVLWQSLTHVALTHFHNDHVGDLPALLGALKGVPHPPRQTPLTLVGPPGFGAFMERLDAVRGAGMLDTGFPVSVHELAPGSVFEDPAAGFRLTTVSTPHTEESVAYRWEGAGGVVGYTGDTGPSQAVAHFLRGCDVLIAECTQPDPPVLDSHLSPASLAALASVARPGRLVVTHAAPPLDPEAAARLVAEAGYDGVVVAGRDGLRLPLQP